MIATHVSTESRQNYATPWPLIGEIQYRFGVRLAIDLAASPENAKCDRYISLPVDSLTIDWRAEIETADIRPAAVGQACGFLNPPFRGVDPWMEKCETESARGARIISLTLASLGTKWYRDHVEGKALSLILRERVTFEGCKDPFPKELMVTLWGFGMSGLGFWSRKR